MSVERADDAQLIGAMLPDAASTSAFSWQDLHDKSRVDDFAQHMIDDTILDHVLDGIHHHNQLDERAHKSWRGEGGYAYTKQTPDLQHIVRVAFSVDYDIGDRLSHNFIETACDLLLLEQKPELVDAMRNAIATVDYELIITALCKWLNAETEEMGARVHAFFNSWVECEFSVDGMVNLWVEMSQRLNESNAFSSWIASPPDTGAVRHGVDLAMNAVRDDFMEVLTP